MALLKILTYPNPILKKKARAVAKIDAKIKKLIADMKETMLDAPGVGLAAPQVAQSVQVIVIELREPVSFKKNGQTTIIGGPIKRDPLRIPPEPDEYPVIALVNPTIMKKSGHQVFTEGCLCLPGVEAPVERPSRVVIRALDENGGTLEIAAQEYMATVFQHEIDHLIGKVFIDRVTDPTTIKYKLPGEIPETERD